jgi:hypothetical protein
MKSPHTHTHDVFVCVCMVIYIYIYISGKCYSLLLLTQLHTTFRSFFPTCNLHRNLQHLVSVYYEKLCKALLVFAICVSNSCKHLFLLAFLTVYRCLSWPIFCWAVNLFSAATFTSHIFQNNIGSTVENMFPELRHNLS